MSTGVEIDPPMLAIGGPTVQNPDKLSNRLVVSMSPVVAPVVCREDEGKVTINIEKER